MCCFGHICTADKIMNLQTLILEKLKVSECTCETQTSCSWYQESNCRQLVLHFKLFLQQEKSKNLQINLQIVRFQAANFAMI